MDFSKLTELRTLTYNDTTNDYWFIQYLGHILDHIERDASGCLTELGQSILKLDIGVINSRLQVSKGEELPQKELVKFCLYMTNAYSICVLFKGMTELVKEPNSKFLENHSFPDYISNDFEELGNRAYILIDQFKKILDAHTKLLKDRYRTVYNSEKLNQFVKQIFLPSIVQSSSGGMPSGLQNARECK